MSPLIHTLRHRTRLTAWLGLLALCAQLLAGGVSNWHMVQRLAGTPSLLDICSSTGGIRSGQDPAHGKGTGSAAQHCPFCLAAGGPALAHTPSLLVARLNLQDTATPPASKGILPRAPDLRHARTRAPPFFA